MKYAPMKKAQGVRPESFLKTTISKAYSNPAQTSLMFDFGEDVPPPASPPVLPASPEIVAVPNDANPPSFVPDVPLGIVATPAPTDKQLPAKKTKRKPSKSTSTENQYAIIDSKFDYVGKLINTFDFRDIFSVPHPSGRIKEMNEKLGYNIVRADLRTVYDRQGLPHRGIAFYELLSRPEKGGQQ